MARTRLAALVLAAVTALGGVASGSAAAHADDPSGPPPFAEGFGLKLGQTGPTAPVNGGSVPIVQTRFDFTLTVTTDEVAPTPGMDDGGHHIRVVLPADYYSNPEKRFPVLYLLNGASTTSDPASYFDYPEISPDAGLIFVMPDGGTRGWYTNWLTQNTDAHAQNWETFHIDQVVPFIDANLRTIADKQHRAVAGISMGGFGALRYAERHPDVFSQAASLSGPIDLSEYSMDLRAAVVASTLYNPAVSSDAIFGSPMALPSATSLWDDASPGTHAAALAGMDVSVYTGNGGGGLLPPWPTADLGLPFLEWWLPGAARWFAHDAGAVGVPTHVVQYGTGAGTAWAVPYCSGYHMDYGCLKADFDDLIPRVQAHFAGQSLNATAPITVANQGLCLDVRTGLDFNGMPVQVWGCNGTLAQRWTVDTSHTVTAFGRCLDVVGGGTANGTPVDIADCNGTSAQQWIAQPDGTLLNPASGRCLSDANSGGAGTQTVIQDCGTGTDQQWTVPSIAS